MENFAQRTGKLSPAKQTLLMLEMQAKLEALERQQNEPIAIIGMGLRFPGQCSDPESFWNLLRNGGDAVSEVPQNRWDIDSYYDPNPDVPGKMNSRWGGFLEEVEQFDAQFFGIPPREAMRMDPQQRLVLEVAWEAFEHAGIAADKLFNTRTGVFISSGPSEYFHLGSGDLDDVDIYSGTGNGFCFSAGRLSYLLGLQGPSIAVDTACSSSLVTVHLACQSLRNNECRIALAGGVNLMLSPGIGVFLSRSHALAADGRCKTFDASADGFVRGEGSGAVVLKRLSDAVADGDNILALIRSSAVNHGGRTSGLTVPNGPAQQALIREALAKAGLEPAQISYVETHGTGTPLGDPIEVEALGTVLGRGRDATTPLLLGSVKTNLGHLEAAAGIAGLIKTVLMLRHREIPPHLHFKDPNPHIAWQELPVQIATELTSWSSAGQPLRAGVSSFGFSGTNAHVIVEEAPAATVDAGVERGVEVLALSAKTEGALQEMSARLARYVKTHEAVGLSDVCYSANIGRSHFGERVAFVSRTREQLLDQLAEVAKGESAEGVVRGRVGQRAPKVAFLFSGQGSQYAGMGQQLMQRDGVYREVLLECEELLRPYLDQPLLQVLSSDELLAQTQYAQPALFAVEYALARQWQSWGVEPALLLGHSTGEYAAACIAGAFTPADGLKLVAARARLMQQHCERGAMLAVTANEELVRAELAALDKDVWIAALNGPEQVVLSGRKEVMERVYPRLEERGLRVKRLAVEQGFHSGLMEPMLDEFAAMAREIKYAPLERAVVSNVSGQVKAIGERLESDYWLRQVRETVRFSDGMKRLQEQGCDVYLEVGPRAMLVWLGQECLGAAAAESEWCWSLREGRDEWEQMLESVGKLYVCGADLKWEAVSHGRKVTLPSYPFQRQRYWIDEKPQRETKPQPSAVQKQVRDWLYRVQWQVAPETTETSNITEANWLLFADRQGVAAALAQRLRAQGQRCVLVQVGPNDDADYQLAGTDASEFRRVLSELNVGDLPWRIVYLWSLDAPATTELTSSSLEEWQRMSCAPLVTLVQSLLAEPQLSEATRLWVVTAGAQATGRSGETLSLAQAPIWGLGKVLALEEAQLWGGLIDLDDARPEQTAAQLQGWIETNGEERVAFRDAVAYVPRVVKLAAANGRGVQIDATGSYFISGGLGALGLTVAEWLVQRGARRLILISRSGLPPSTNGERSEREAVLERLREQGAEVQIVSVDAGDETAMRAVLEKLASSGQRLKGVIHAAGVLQPHGVGELSEAKLLAGLRGKMVGGWVLQQLTRKMELDFFISFSSVSAVWGGIRLGAYAAGNEFLSQLGHYQQQANSKCKALTINWGPWEELEIGSELEQAGYRKLMDELAAARMRGGADVNAVSQQGLLSEVKRMMDQMGVARLSGAQGVAGLEEVLKLDLPQMIVCNVDWSKFLPIYQARRRRPLFDLLQPDRAEAVAPQRSSKLIRSLESAPAQERQKLMETYLQNHVAKALYMNPEDVSTERNLLELGMNSLTIMEVINELRQDIDLTIYPKEFFNQPTLKTLAAYVITELDRKDATNTGDRSTLTAFYPQSLQHIATRTRQAAPGKRNPGVVLLLSSPRSGSTLLRVMLAGHPQIFSPPELHLLSFVGMKERHQTLSLTDLGEGLHRAFMELRQTSIDETKTLIDQLVEADTPIQDVYGMLQQDLGTRLLVDKSPTYAGNIDTLRQAERMFEGAKYIHLVRHPYSVIESFVRVRIHQAAGVPAADPAMLGETVWATTNKNILEFFKEVDADRHHLVRYEELVNDPRAVMLRLCDFLNLPFDDALLKPYDGNRMTDGLHSHSWGIGDVNFLRHDSIDASLGEVWRKIKLPNALGGFAREVAAELSYPLPDEESTPLRAAAASLSAGFEEGRI